MYIFSIYFYFFQNTVAGKLKPQNFYMKYLQIDPSENGLKYQYYYFQKYVDSRYNTGKSSRDIKSPTSLLMSKLLSQMLNPMSLFSNPLTLLSPLTLSNKNPNSVGRLPIKIYMNEKSAAKYQRNLDSVAKLGRAKRALTTEEEPIFNEGPFKVDDKKHLEWAKDFLKEFPDDKRPSTYHVIHQQPSTTDLYQWYHPFPGEEATFYTIEPTVTRATHPGEPEDLCNCCHHDTPATPDDTVIHRVGEKDPFYE